MPYLVGHVVIGYKPTYFFYMSDNDAVVALLHLLPAVCRP